jgi:predicted RNA binding protein YcfA (HicA-like mRNA interferase family)
MERLILLLGFEKIHQKGHHVFYKHKDGRATTLPCHSGTKIAPLLLREVLMELQISIDQFNDFLSEVRGKKPEAKGKSKR